MSKMRAGVVGAGFIGMVHIEALRRLGFVEVVAITEISGAKKKAEMLNIDHAFENYTEMIDTMNLDTVHICTPNNTHCEIALYAFSKGVNVICEKPFCCNIKDAEIMVKAAEESGLVHALNFHNRFYPVVHHLKQMIQNDDLGRIVSVHGVYLQDWLLYDTDYDWRLSPQASGYTRAVADIGSHWLDLAEFVTNMKITEVVAEISTVHKIRKVNKKQVNTFEKPDEDQTKYTEVQIDTDDMAGLLLKFSNGALGSVMISQLFSGKKNNVELLVSGTKKSASWNLESLNDLIIGNRDEPNQILTKSPANLHNTSRILANYPAGHAEGFPDAFKQCFKQIYQYILGTSEAHDFADFNDGLHNMELERKILISSQKKSWMQI